MRLILFLGVVLKFIVPISGGTHARYIICSDISENLNIPDVMPIRYDVYIIVKPQQRILMGNLSILIEVKKPIWNITLQAKSAYGYEIMDEQGSASNVYDFQFCEAKEILILLFNKMLDKGRYKFEIAYRSVSYENVEDTSYPSTWTTKNQHWMLTNLYASNAIRGLFPCWNDLRIKATYNISIQTPADYLVLSSIPEESATYISPSLSTLPFGIKLTKYKELVSMPIHLITFLIIDDITRDFESRDIHYMWRKIYTYKEFTYILDMAQMLTSFFFTSMRINTFYLSSNINHVVLPNSPMKSMGAPGLVVYRERDITFDKLLDSPGRYLDIMTLISYEMARQLFVSVISLQLEADYVWLNEIFASFCGYYIMDQILPSDRLMELFVVKIIQPTLNSDMLLERESVIHKAKNNDGIDGLLYPLFYHKKAFALIRMLFKLYNPNTFKKAIRTYVHTRTKDMWTILEEVHSLKFESNYTVKEIMNTWLTVKHYPELFIKRDYESWIAICHPSSIEYRISLSKSKPKWIIPINYITKSSYDSYNISEVIWFKWDKIKTITAINSDDFLIVNAEQTGYYRVNYDKKNWLLISTHLQYNFSHIPPINRAQLLNDAYYYTIKNQLDINIFINIIKYLKWDTDFVAWYPMFNILSDMSVYFNFPESESIKKYFLEILKEVLTKIGYEEDSSEDTVENSYRNLIRRWTCKLGPSMCRTAAFERLMIYINHKDEMHRIPAMSQEWLTCDGLKLENLNLWEQILNKSINNKNMKLLENLSCTENSTIIVHYLTLMLRSDYFSKLEQSMGPICQNVIKKHVKKNAVLQFVIDNYSAIVKRFPDEFPVGTLLKDLIMNVYSPKDLKMIKEHADRLFGWGMESISVFRDFLESINFLISKREGYLIKVQNKFQMFHNWIKNV